MARVNIIVQIHVAGVEQRYGERLRFADSFCSGDVAVFGNKIDERLGHSDFQEDRDPRSDCSWWICFTFEVVFDSCPYLSNFVAWTFILSE